MTKTNPTVKEILEDYGRTAWHMGELKIRDGKLKPELDQAQADIDKRILDARIDEIDRFFNHWGDKKVAEINKIQMLDYLSERDEQLRQRYKERTK